jgi:hypothetical protein
MDAVLKEVEQPLRLNGDGRFDSPGHSAMYGMYTFMDAATSKIVANNLVKVRFRNKCFGNLPKMSSHAMFITFMFVP